MRPDDILLLPSAHRGALMESLLQVEQYRRENLPALSGLQKEQLQQLPGSDPKQLPGGMQIQGQYAVIPVQGVIGRHLPWWVVEFFGWVDQVQVEDALDIVMGDDSIKTVIFDCNSPGGMATGTPELSAKIREVSASGRRTIAWVDYLAASGCYWTACSCDAIYAIPSARIGSIGAVMAFADVSAYWEKEGVKLEAFASAEGKLRGMWGRATSESDREYFKASVDRWGEWFRESVRARRGDLPELAWSGDTWDGRAAVEMGLIDGLATSLAGALVLDEQRAR